MKAARAHSHAAMETREIFLTVLVLYSSTASLVLSDSNPRYERKLPSGRTVMCDLCPPGYRLQKQCTETQPTECRPCAVGLYTEYWNYIYDCLPCNLCSSDQVEVQKCTSSVNRVCECKEGYFRDSYFCRPHTACQSGYGVKEKGTPVKDTVCERCQNGHYTDEHQKCVPHTKCKPDEKLLLHGTRQVDNVCVNCSSIECNGWVKYAKPHFIAMFKKFAKPGAHRLKRSIRRLTRSKDCFSNPDVCFQHLEQWFNEATEQDVCHLPKLLQDNNISNLTTKIKHIINKAHDVVSLCTRTSLDLNKLPDHK